MPIDRKKVLEQRERAKAIIAQPEVPQDIRDLAKQALDSADVAMGLDDARLRAEANSPTKASS